MDEPMRADTIARISKHLECFDDDALQELDRLTDPETYEGNATPEPADPASFGGSEPEVGRRAFTRRELVGGSAMIGLGALLATAALSTGRLPGAGAQGADGRQMRVLLDLHRRLEALGLDDRLGIALATISAAAAIARGLAGALAKGLALVANAADLFEQAMGPLEVGVARLSGIIERLSLGIEVLGNTLQAGAEPMVVATADFIDRVIESLPFGFADGARATLEAIRNVLSLGPDTVAAAGEGLIAPLREYWLPDEDSGEPGLRGRLLDPLRAQVISNGTNLVRAIEGWQAAWDDEIESAVRPILQERQDLRAEIAGLEQQLGLSSPRASG